MDPSPREIVERFFDASQDGDLETVATMVHDEMVMEWPQSGERFRGRANVLGAMRAQKIRPVVAGVRRIVGAGDAWVVTMPLRYGQDLYHYVAIVELDGAKVRRGTGYFAAPFPPQADRAPFADREERPPPAG